MTDDSVRVGDADQALVSDRDVTRLDASEDAPADFICAICERAVTNRWNYSPRDYERPPICKSCENVAGYSWSGSAVQRTKPRGGSHRDRREALRIGALADAISEEANRQHWSAKYGRA